MCTRIIRAAGAASLWLGLFGGWVAAAGAFTPGPEEMLCCNGSSCCGGAGGSSIACRLAYGASGTVVDARSGEPIGGAVVTVLDVSTTSNPDGTYGAFGNHPETCHLDYYVPITAHADGYAPYFDALYTSVPIRYADIRLEPLDSGTGNAITGVVAESPHCEGGMNGVTVVLEPLGLQTESGTADHGTPAGYFEFNNLPPGEYTLRTEPPCNLHGCWDPVTIRVSTSDVDASLCLLPRRNAAQVSVGRAVGAPGGNTTVDVTIADAHSAGGDPARVSATIGFEPDAGIMHEGDNSPACDAVADVEAAAFTWLPAGCTPGITCTAVHAELQIGALALNNGTVLFSCGVAITERESDSCYHPLRCLDLVVSGASGAPLAAVCEHGSVESRVPVPPLSYTFSVIPPAPVIGDHVRVEVAVVGDGGLPAYTLHGAQPQLSGSTTVVQGGPVSGTVAFDLEAVQQGVASLVLEVNYETVFGCPGSTVFAFTRDESAPFLVEIAAGDATPVPTPTRVPSAVVFCPTPTLPLCPAGQAPICSPRVGDQCGQCTCQHCVACPTGQVFTDAVNSCACVVDTAPPPAQGPETSGGSAGGSCAIDRRATGDGLGWLVGADLLVLLALRAARFPRRT